METTIIDPQKVVGASIALEQKKTRAARLPVISNASFILLKLLVWMLTGSMSVLAETFHSAADLVGSVLSYLSVRMADTPPDEEHAYGHGKFENLASMAIAIIIVSAACLIIGESAQRLIHIQAVRSPIYALIVMAIATLVNICISNYLLKVGKETDSPALCADGHHLQTDVVTSTGVFIGILLVTVTHKNWIDAATAIIVATLIFRVGFRIAKEALFTLTDIALPQEEIDIINAALSSDKRILAHHKLRTRKAGSHRHVDVHILIDDNLSFVDAHNLCEEIEDMLRNTLPNLHPIIHAEPFAAEIKRHRSGL
jgi:cation diffusion facilitator family transporter